MVCSPVSDLGEHSLSVFPSGASAKALFAGWILQGVRLLGAQRDCASVGFIVRRRCLWRPLGATPT
jgi:hypothetical protein